MWLIVSRIVALPLIAGLAYEVIRLAARFERFRAVRIVLAPGLWLQRLTTREPTLDQVAVSIRALERVLAARRATSRGPGSRSWPDDGRRVAARPAGAAQGAVPRQPEALSSRSRPRATSMTRASPARSRPGARSSTAGLHPATGGSGLEACSGDMLLEALVACAGVTLKAVATAIGVELRSAHLRAEGDLDFRGTLGVDREAPVGFSDIRLTFDLDERRTPGAARPAAQADRALLRRASDAAHGAARLRVAHRRVDPAPRASGRRCARSRPSRRRLHRSRARLPALAVDRHLTDRIELAHDDRPAARSACARRRSTACARVAGPR